MAYYSQGYMFVSDYSDEFHTLATRAEMNGPEYITVGRYKRGFRKPIRNIMHLSTITTMLEAFQAPHNVEALLMGNVTSSMKLFITHAASSPVPNIGSTISTPVAIQAISP